jgi:hypothetical protein
MDTASKKILTPISSGPPLASQELNAVLSLDLSLTGQESMQYTAAEKYFLHPGFKGIICKFLSPK